MSADLTRRRFLREAGCGSAALACLTIGLPADVGALPVRSIEGHGAAAERSYPIPLADGVSIDRTTGVILVRLDGHVFALYLSCPHQQAAVKWVEKDHRFACTKHDSKYEPTGAYVSGRSTRNLDRFPIRREAAAVVVTTDHVIRIDQDPAGWTGAIVSV